MATTSTLESIIEALEQEVQIGRGASRATLNNIDLLSILYAVKQAIKGSDGTGR